MIKDILKLWQYRVLIANLIMREIKQRYKQSILGYFWVILNPFFQMLVMTFIFSTVMRVPVPGVPYAVFLYAGLLPWTLFATSLSSSTVSLVDNANLIKQINFPREIFPLSTTLPKIVDFFLASTVFTIFMFLFHIKINFNII